MNVDTYVHNEGVCSWMSRILIAVEQTENRRLLAESLSRYYEVVVGDSMVQARKTLPLLDEPFDLCILDGRHWIICGSGFKPENRMSNPFFSLFFSLQCARM